MYNETIKENVPVLASIQYVHNKDVEYDYIDQPRPCHNFVFLLEGKGVVQSNGKEILLNAGDVLFIPKNSTYACTWFAKPKTIYNSLHFLFSPNCDPFLDKGVPVQLLPNANFSNLLDLLKTIEKYQYSKTVSRYFALSAFYNLCGQLLQTVKTLPKKQTNLEILPAINYIERNYYCKTSINYLASLCFLSASRFFFLFKKHTGVSPIAYKNRLAVRRAEQELLYDKNARISDVAERHGFSSVVYFERIFKKITGKSPSAYKKERSTII